MTKTEKVILFSGQAALQHVSGVEAALSSRHRLAGEANHLETSWLL